MYPIVCDRVHMCTLLYTTWYIYVLCHIQLGNCVYLLGVIVLYPHQSSAFQFPEACAVAKGKTTLLDRPSEDRARILLSSLIVPMAGYLPIRTVIHDYPSPSIFDSSDGTTANRPPVIVPILAGGTSDRTYDGTSLYVPLSSIVHGNNQQRGSRVGSLISGDKYIDRTHRLAIRSLRFSKLRLIMDDTVHVGSCRLMTKLRPRLCTIFGVVFQRG